MSCFPKTAFSFAICVLTVGGFFAGQSLAQISDEWVGSNRPSENLVYKKVDGSKWKEYHKNGAEFFLDWEEKYRESSSVMLYDAKRNYWLKLTPTNAMLQTKSGGDFWELIKGGFKESSAASALKLDKVVYAKLGEKQQAGTFIRCDSGDWVEMAPDGMHVFDEVRKDKNEIQLKRNDNGAVVLIDLSRNTVRLRLGAGYATEYRDLYTIIATESNANEPGGDSSTSDKPESKLVQTPTAIYRLKVNTGSATDILGLQAAGTDSKIMVKLIGTKGYTDWFEFTGNNGFFEANTSDEIQKRLGDVGTLTGIEIDKDNGGNGPDWYPTEFVVEVNGVTYGATNRYWVNDKPTTLPLERK